MVMKAFLIQGTNGVLFFTFKFVENYKLRYKTAEMKDWLTLSFLYDFNPSLYNYINFTFHHFQFCGNDDLTISGKRLA